MSPEKIETKKERKLRRKLEKKRLKLAKKLRALEKKLSALGKPPKQVASKARRKVRKPVLAKPKKKARAPRRPSKPSALVSTATAALAQKPATVDDRGARERYSSGAMQNPGPTAPA